MDTPYKVNWVFVTRYTQDQVRNEKIEEVNEHIEETIERAKEVLSGSIVNMIGLNQDLQKVFKQLSGALNTIEMYDDWMESDKTTVETLLGDIDDK
ncbi:MAG: hypothetical protein CBD62_01155 [Candidatus Pelagibacter sp. TMED202]|nr:MAG: hypothetical protein CBD62_01155 [Candidatus Pelagibacter sp. TMED202]|tara:strand:- start:5959 stop:6246 length:288 start_codon:yes stop_codon:yes gene_type:complete